MKTPTEERKLGLAIVAFIFKWNSAAFVVNPCFAAHLATTYLYLIFSAPVIAAAKLQMGG